MLKKFQAKKWGVSLNSLVAPRIGGFHIFINYQAITCR